MTEREELIEIITQAINKRCQLDLKETYKENEQEWIDKSVGTEELGGLLADAIMEWHKKNKTIDNFEFEQRWIKQNSMQGASSPYNGGSVTPNKGRMK